MPNQAEILKQKFQNSLALPWEQVLTEEVIQQVLEQQQVRYRQRFYTPVVTLWAWLSQVLDQDKSLSNAVSRVIAWSSAAGVQVPSADTGAYSKARKRFSLGVLEQLLSKTGQALQTKVKLEECWCGRRVKVYDGTERDDE